MTISLGSRRGLHTASAVERPFLKFSSHAAFAPGLKSKRDTAKNNDKKRLVLIGGGHAHAQVIKAFNAASRPKDLQVTLIDVQKAASYSGLVPGSVSGLYKPEDTLLELQPLADWANIDFINDRVVDIDMEQKLISLEGNDEPIQFDAVSLDIGSTSRGLKETKGAREYTIPTRPISVLVSRMEDATAELVQNPRPVNVVVVGGGAAGIELAMSIHGRWQPLNDDFHVTLLDAGEELLPNESDANRQALREIMSEKGITIKHGCQVQEILKDRVCLDNQETIPFSHCIWATGASAHDLAFNLGKKGLAVSDRGWIRVNENLQSVSHPHIFAAGDCCSIEGLPGGKSPPKAGVYAVRAGPILTENLSKFVDDKMEPSQLTPYHPQDDFLKLIICGDGKALGFRFGIPLYGKWVFELKNAIDQTFMDLFRADKLPNLNEGKPLDTSQFDTPHTVTGTPPQMNPSDAAALLQRTDDDVDFQEAWNVLREMAADEDYRAKVLKHVPVLDLAYL
jgi:selenide,water dikinase